MPGGSDIRAGRAYVELAVHDKLAKGLARAAARLRAFGATVRHIGMSMVRTAAMLAAPFAIAGKFFSDFDEKMAKVATMLKGADLEFLPGFREQVKTFAVKFGKDTSDIADGLYDILSAQVPASRAMEYLRASMESAVAGNAAVKDSTSVILTLMETYGDHFKDAGDASDFLFAIIRRGRTDMERLAPVMGMMIATVKEAGLSLEDMGAALALVTRATGQTEGSIVALNSIAMTFLKPTEEAKRVWHDLYKTEMSAATLQAEGMLSVLQKLSKLDPNTVAQMFPNRRALRGLLPALSKLEGFAKDMAAMHDRAGETAEAYRKMAASISHAFAQLKQAAIRLFVEIGSAVSEPLRRASEIVKGVIKGLTDWVRGHKELLGKVLKLVLVVGVLGAGIALFGAAISAVGGILGLAAGAVSAFGTAIAFLVSPIGLIIAAVAVMGILIVKYTDWVGDALSWLGGKFKWLKDDAVKAWGGIADALASGDISLAAKILWLTLKLEWQRGVQKLTEIWVQVKEFALKTWYGIQAAWEITVNAITTTLINGVAAMKEAWASLATFCRSAWETSTDWIAKRILEVQGMFDEELDVEGAKSMIDVQSEVTGAKVEDEKKARLAAIETERKERLKTAEQIHQDAMAKIGAELGAVSGKYDKEISGSKDAVRKARQEWEAAIKKASEVRKEKEAEGPGAPGKPRLPKLDLKSMMADISRKMSVRGTFNVAAIQGLMGGDAMDRTADATEETAENTKRMLDELENQEGLAFS